MIDIHKQGHALDESVSQFAGCTICAAYKGRTLRHGPNIARGVGVMWRCRSLTYSLSVRERVHSVLAVIA